MLDQLEPRQASHISIGMISKHKATIAGHRIRVYKINIHSFHVLQALSYFSFYIIDFFFSFQYRLSCLPNQQNQYPQIIT